MQTLEPNTLSPGDAPVCKQCGKRPPLDGYPNAFCQSCREEFIKFPIPLWVKGFGIGILLLMIIALFSFPGELKTGIHVKRAKIAAEQHKYFTAQKELAQVLMHAPHMKDAKAEMMTAAFYNMDVNTFITMANELKGETFEDGALSSLNNLIDRVEDYYPSDSFGAMVNRYQSPSAIPRDSFKLYVDNHSYEPFSVLSYINTYGDNEDSAWCDSSIHAMLSHDPDYIPGLMSAISLSRHEHKYDSALQYCDHLSAINKESTYALAAKARIFLAQGKLKEGIVMAKKALNIEPSDGFSEATLALGYHLNHQDAERDQVISGARSDSYATEYMDYVRDVMSGKENFN